MSAENSSAAAALIISSLHCDWSGHRGRQLELERMTGDRAEMELAVADTAQARRRSLQNSPRTRVTKIFYRWTTSSDPYLPRPSRDLYRVYDW